MRVVIVGGNDRMSRLYKDVCRDYGYNAKVFTEPHPTLSQQIGSPDLMIVFTGTVCHKMVICALNEAKRCGAFIARSHSSSKTALCSILSEHCECCRKCKEKCRRAKNI